AQAKNRGDDGQARDKQANPAPGRRWTKVLWQQPGGAKRDGVKLERQPKRRPDRVLPITTEQIDGDADRAKRKRHPGEGHVAVTINGQLVGGVVKIGRPVLPPVDEKRNPMREKPVE